LLLSIAALEKHEPTDEETAVDEALQIWASVSALNMSVATRPARTPRTFARPPMLVHATDFAPGAGGFAASADAPLWARTSVSVTRRSNSASMVDADATLAGPRRLLEWLSSREELRGDQLVVVLAAGNWSFGGPPEGRSCMEAPDHSADSEQPALSFTERYRRLVSGQAELVFATKHVCDERDAPWPDGCAGLLTQAMHGAAGFSHTLMSSDAFAGPKRAVERMLREVLSYASHKICNRQHQVSPQLAFARYWTEHPEVSLPSTQRLRAPGPLPLTCGHVFDVPLSGELPSQAVKLDDDGALFTSAGRFARQRLDAAQVVLAVGRSNPRPPHTRIAAARRSC
jgi:hypothetical protein